MKTKSFVGISLAVVVAISSLGLLAGNHQKAYSAYNTNPDVSKKIIGSTAIREQAWSLPINSLADLVKTADLVVIGEVISDGVTTTAAWPNVIGDPEGKTEFGKRPPITVTHNQFKIAKTLYGKADSDTITLVQLGKAGDNKGQTKVQKNKKMLLVLHGGQDGIYGAVCYEDGMFEIDDTGKVMSLSKDLVEAKYDGTQVDLLTKDIVKALRSLNK